MKYQICNRCVMDNVGDPDIRFDENNLCNYCNRAESLLSTLWYPEKDRKRLGQLVEKLKLEGKGKAYDALIGISGGLDSSYIAYIMSSYGLRLLAVHIDDGLDTDIATRNIRALCEHCGITLRTVCPDAEQYYALTKAYFLAGVPELAVPQDNLIFTYLYDCATENDIKYFISGSNLALESILQKGYMISPRDLKNIMDIQRNFGTKPIDKLRLMSDRKWNALEKSAHFEVLKPLNLIEYDRNGAIEEMRAAFGFEYYGRKHYESHLTRFMQTYYLNKKFGIDKRKSHYSSMIMSGQLTREQALELLKEPLYIESELEEDIIILCDKLGFTREEFDALMEQPGVPHTRYKFTPKRTKAPARILTLGHNLYKKIFKKDIHGATVE